ncbi:AAA family ATPase [Streptomyces iakyrus]|uniref:AAA family ATPase n=1 Tax=Streptomyces iakyrus TaxID=68219 RepID=UPI0036F083DA
MVAERLRDALHLESCEPVLVLYGPGTEDTFVCTDYQERSLADALLVLLRAEGYQRIAFCSPAEPLYFRDAASLATASGSVPGHAGPGPQAVRTAPTGPIRGPQGIRRQLGRHDSVAPTAAAAPVPPRPDPLWEPDPLAVAPVTAPERPLRVVRGRRPTSRSAAEQLLHQYMTQDGILTAVVVEQAEAYLHRAPRTSEMNIRIGEWLQGATGKNLCVLIFSATTETQIVEQIRAHGGPAALAGYLERRAGRDISPVAGAVRAPARPELCRLVQLSRLRDGLAMPDWADTDRLLNGMNAQAEVLARAWLARLARASELSASVLGGWGVRLPKVSALEELEALPGLEEVKDFVRRLVAVHRVERQLAARGGDAQAPSRHLVFRGNPGTGKTTVARIVARVYQELGVLARGHVVEPELHELVHEHVGGTTQRTTQVIDRALDGVLFIDEVYRLTAEDRGGFGQEAVDTLLSRMENQRDRLVVIVAGYSAPMEQFLRSNPGLRRRFPVTNELEFKDYTPELLVEILLRNLEQLGHVPDAPMSDLLGRVVRDLHRRKDRSPESFGNGGEMRNLAQSLHERWAQRISLGSAIPDLDSPLAPADLPPEYHQRSTP